jgi:hypothetical protein
MEFWELEARETIRDTVVRYSTYADGGRFEDVLGLFTAGAVIEVDGDTYRGREGIRSLFTGTQEAAQPGSVFGDEAPRFRHLTGSHQIDLYDQQSASGRCYLAVFMNAGLDHWGRYLDDYAPEDGVWRIARRRIQIEGATPGGWRADLAAQRGLT